MYSTPNWPTPYSVAQRNVCSRESIIIPENHGMKIMIMGFDTPNTGLGSDTCSSSDSGTLYIQSRLNKIIDESETIILF